MTAKVEKATADVEHPLERARRELRRGNPTELAKMREQIASAAGFRIDLSRLEPEESGEKLLRLHKQATESEGWEPDGFTHYGLASRLSKDDHRRWRALVGKAAGCDLDALDEDATALRRISELALRALTPVPERTAVSSPGTVVLPVGVWQDILDGRLFAIDVCVLSVVAFVFQTGKLHPQTEKRRDAMWGPDEVLFVRGLHRLLPQWSEQIQYHGDAVAMDRQGIESRLTSNGWLELEQQGSHAAVRPGPRLLGQQPPSLS